jgi:sulfatase maturation enzyme AslB (radical SAM superfamily)
VLEDAPHQLKAELDLEAKKELVSHLYNVLQFRRLTLSGGEVVIFGKHPPTGFIELLRHIRQFRFPGSINNLEMELYTNGTYIDEEVALEMNGVIDTVAVTIDSTNDEFLSEIGRNFGRYTKYYEHITHVCGLLVQNGIELKLHSVIGTKNHLSLPNEVTTILDCLEEKGVRISCWKFYQYMSYDAPEKDGMHAIPTDIYQAFQRRVENALEGRNVRLHFKDNEEMNASLFNILSYGNAQYMRSNDTWSTSQRTSDLRLYNSMQELFAKHDIDEALFHRYHELTR